MTERRISDPTIKQKEPEPEIVVPSIEPQPVPDTRESTIIPKPRLPGIPSVIKPLVGIIAGLALLWFGIFNAGGFYEQGSRLSGNLAVFFYVWQVGSVLETVGIVCVYHFGKELWKARNLQ